MATVYVKPPTSISSAWSPTTHNGYPNGKARMVSLAFTPPGTTLAQPALTYVFPYAPVEAQIGQIGLEYVEIERPNNFKLLDVRGPQLLQVAMNFVVVDRPSGGLLPVDDELMFLSTIANRNSPVAFAGIGDLLGKADTTFRLWRITDMSLTVVRRDTNGKAIRADASMSLTEDKTPRLEVRTLPRITYTSTPQTYSSGTTSTKPQDPAPAPSIGWSDLSRTTYTPERT